MLFFVAQSAGSLKLQTLRRFQGIYDSPATGAAGQILLNQTDGHRDAEHGNHHDRNPHQRDDAAGLEEVVHLVVPGRERDEWHRPQGKQQGGGNAEAQRNMPPSSK